MFRKKTIASLRHAVLAPALLMALLALCGAALAADGASAPQYMIEQPAQAVADALQAIARETSTSVLFEPDSVRGRVARPVSGRLTGFEAITAAIQGTGLIALQMKDGAVVVKLLKTPAVPRNGVPLSAAAANSKVASGGAVVQVDPNNMHAVTCSC